MNWVNFAAFVAMGGYGLYVWGAFGVTALVMVVELLALRTRRRALRAEASATRPGARLRDAPAATVRVEYREGAT